MQFGQCQYLRLQAESMVSLNCPNFTVTSLKSRCKRIFQNFNHTVMDLLRSVGKQSTKIDKKKNGEIFPGSTVPGLSMNSFFEFNDAKLGGKLVQSVSRFQSHPPWLVISWACANTAEQGSNYRLACACVKRLKWWLKCLMVDRSRRGSPSNSAPSPCYFAARIRPGSGTGASTSGRGWAVHEATTGPRPCSCTHGPDNACIVTRTGNCISAALWRTSVAVLLVNSSPAQPAPPAGPEVRPESARRRKNPARPCQSKSYVGEFEQRQLLKLDF